ncbi:MAG: ATP-binding cassette domain-containing protein [Candidatus Dormiibacterota bacterium]
MPQAMGSLAGQTVATMSRGEQLRVVIAAGVCVAPKLLLLDEPTSQLDAQARDGVIEMLLSINDEFGATIVVVTHDPTVAAAMPRTFRSATVGLGLRGAMVETSQSLARTGACSSQPTS